MNVSVVIVNYRVKYFLEQTLLSVREALHGIEHEIIVVDNNSGDDSISFLKERFHEVIFVENTENVGFGRANNQGFELAKGEFTIVLNPDTIISRQTVESCIDWMGKHDDCGAIGVKMIDGNGKFLPESKRSFPTPWVSFCKIFGLSVIFPTSPLFARYHLRYLSKDKVHSIDIMSGAYMFVRTDLLKEIHGFDEDFFMYGEDIDISFRIKQKGYKNYYLPATIIHYKGESTKKGTLKYVKIFYEAMVIFMKKHYAHFSFFYSIVIQAGIWTRASIDVFRRIAKKIFRKVKIETAQQPVHWLVLSNNFSRVKASLAKTCRADSFTPVGIETLDKMVGAELSSDVLIDNSSYNYQQIIDVIEKYGTGNIDFHIFSAQNEVIISPKMEQI